MPARIENAKSFLNSIVVCIPDSLRDGKTGEYVSPRKVYLNKWATLSLDYEAKKFSMFLYGETHARRSKRNYKNEGGSISNKFWEAFREHTEANAKEEALKKATESAYKARIKKGFENMQPYIDKLAGKPIEANSWQLRRLTDGSRSDCSFGSKDGSFKFSLEVDEHSNIIIDSFSVYTRRVSPGNFRRLLDILGAERYVAPPPPPPIKVNETGDLFA